MQTPLKLFPVSFKCSNLALPYQRNIINNNYSYVINCLKKMAIQKNLKIRRLSLKVTLECGRTVKDDVVAFVLCIL